jgi:hypothetical protein
MLPLASFTADGADDQDRVYEVVAERHPNAAVIIPPRARARRMGGLRTSFPRAVAMKLAFSLAQGQRVGIPIL